MALIFEKSLRNFAGLFEVRQPQEQRATWVIPVLVLTVLLGAALRFWGLGAVGLHGEDEDTTALPAVHLATHGTPEFPSGMFYARAIAHTYLIAGSVSVFGQTEWAIRLPSALCGVAMIFLAYFVGRRFLSPVWNAAFVASVALLPDLILLSQNARMYIFLVTCIAAYTASVFAWERSGHWGYLVGAVVLLMVGIQFQLLMVFATPILFLPGLLQADRRKLLQGALSSAMAVVGYVLMKQWITSNYPARVPIDDAGAPEATVQVGTAAAQSAGMLVELLSGLAAVALAWLIVRRIPAGWNRRFAWAGLSLGLVALLALHYHVGLILLLAGAVVAARGSRDAIRPLLVLGIVTLGIAIAQFTWLHMTGVGSRGVIADIMMGTPRAWPFLIFSEYSPVALVVTLAGAAAAVWAVARGRKIPDYWLYFLLALWLPLFVIGAMRPYSALRYLSGSLLPLLIGGFFVGQHLLARCVKTADPRRRARIELIAAIVLLAVVVKPLELVRTANAGYDIHPDHKGAAEYIRSLNLGPRDIVLAEDVIMQTYYLGQVDYWFVGPDVGTKFARPRDGVFLDVYTSTPILTTAEEMQALVSQADRGAIYIISSAENQRDGRLSQRGESLARFLEDPNLEVAFTGRDGVTKVWRIPAPVAAGPAASGNG